MEIGFSKDKRDFMAEETFLSLACFCSSANKSLLNLILLGDICYRGGVLSFTKHRDCTFKTYMKICKYSSGMTFPLPPDRAVQPCQNTGRGREVRWCPWGQNVLPSSSQLFLSKAVLNPEDVLTDENSCGSHSFQLCPRWVKLSSHRSYKLKSHKTINMDVVSATREGHVHAHVFQNPNHFPPTWKAEF